MISLNNAEVAERHPTGCGTYYNLQHTVFPLNIVPPGQFWGGTISSPLILTGWYNFDTSQANASQMREFRSTTLTMDIQLN